MTVDEIEKLLDTGREQRIILYRDNGEDVDIRGVVEDLMAEVKDLRDEGWSGLCIVLEAEVNRLREGIEKVLKWRNFDGDGISDPLRKELYELLGVIKEG